MDDLDGALEMNLHLQMASRYFGMELHSPRPSGVRYMNEVMAPRDHGHGHGHGNGHDAE